MTTDTLAVAGLVAVGIALGFIWGRLSARFPIPEMIRMLTTLLWTGAIGFAVGFPLSFVFFGRKILNSPHEGAVLATAISCFAAGVMLGVPGIFGWALGYRQPSARAVKRP